MNSMFSVYSSSESGSLHTWPNEFEADTPTPERKSVLLEDGRGKIAMLYCKPTLIVRNRYAPYIPREIPNFVLAPTNVFLSCAFSVSAES